VAPARQSIKPPAKKVRRGKKIAVATRTLQGQVVTWRSSTKKVCTMSKGSKGSKGSQGKVRTKKKGKCKLVATAPGTAALSAYRGVFTIKIR
jgi:hypothetical protein